MQVNNLNHNNLVPLKDRIEVEVMKKSREVVKHQITDILEKSFENIKEIQKEAAKATGAGGVLNIQA